MFSIRQATAYCRESIEGIVGYKEALNSNEQYDIHHKFEDMGLSSSDLKQLGLYYKRPACELIFISKPKHTSHHDLDRWQDSNKVSDFANWSKSAWESLEFRQKQKEGLHKVQATAEYRVNLSKGIKKALSTEKARAARSALVQKQWNDNPERRNRQKEITTALWTNTEYRNKVIARSIAARSSAEHIQKITEINRKKAQDPKYLETLKIARDTLSRAYKLYKNAGGQLNWNQWRTQHKAEKSR